MPTPGRLELGNRRTSIRRIVRQVVARRGVGGLNHEIHDNKTGTKLTKKTIVLFVSFVPFASFSVS
jgi:hypothetical protein